MSDGQSRTEEREAAKRNGTQRMKWRKDVEVDGNGKKQAVE